MILKNSIHVSRKTKKRMKLITPSPIKTVLSIPSTHTCRACEAVFELNKNDVCQYLDGEWNGLYGWECNICGARNVFKSPYGNIVRNIMEPPYETCTHQWR